MRKFLIVTIFACVLAFGECGQRVDITLSGRDIPKDDFWSAADPYVKVFYKFNENQNWISYGQTRVIDDNGNPNWPEIFAFDYVGGDAQKVRYELWDSDIQYDDLVGTLELPVGEVVNSAQGGRAVERSFSPSGKGRLIMSIKVDGAIP